MRGLILGCLCLVFLLGACINGDGDYLSTVVPGTIAARLVVPASLRTPDGWLRTDAGYAVRLDALSLELGALTLVGSGGGDGGAAMDLLALQAQAAVPVTTASTTLPRVLAGVALSACTPACGLGPGFLQVGRLRLLRLAGTGQARDDTGQARLPAGTPLQIDLDPGAAPLVVAEELGLPLDRRTPAQLYLSALLDLPPGLLDGLDLGAGHPSQVCLGCPAGPASVPQRLRQNLAGSSVLTISLTDPSAAP